MAKLYWITGYSGAGKTTIGRELHQILKQYKDASAIIDGDEIREVFGNDLGYTREDRFKNAMRIAKLCKMLTSQGIDVVCCTVSMFEDVRSWLRENSDNYIEVYLKVPEDVLLSRDQKGLYSERQLNVAGVDLILEEPQNPDIIIENEGSLSAKAAAQMIFIGKCYFASSKGDI